MTNSFITINSVEAISNLLTKEEGSLVKATIDKLAIRNGCSRFHIRVLPDAIGCTGKILKGATHVYGINMDNRCEVSVNLDFMKNRNDLEVLINTPRIEDVSWMKDSSINEQYIIVYRPNISRVMARRTGRVQFWNRVK